MIFDTSLRIWQTKNKPVSPFSAYTNGTASSGNSISQGYFPICPHHTIKDAYIFFMESKVVLQTISADKNAPMVLAKKALGLSILKR